MKITKLINYLENPYRFFSLLGARDYLNFLSDKKYLNLIYRGYTGEKLNFTNPKSYNEKLQWLKVNNRNPRLTDEVDKYQVRKIVSKLIGEEYLIPLLGVYNEFDEINFDLLPKQFVLKCTHDSGGVIFCTDKSSFEKKEAENKIKKWLKRNFYYPGREWPYKDVQPKIICEQYLTADLIDYKIMCFHGEPKLIQVHRNNGKRNHTIDFYDTEWKMTKIERRKIPRSNTELPKPEKLTEMLDIARILSKDDIHVRIDLYIVAGKIFFGEKTFYPASGFALFNEKEHDYLLGEWIKLNEC